MKKLLLLSDKTQSQIYELTEKLDKLNYSTQVNGIQYVANVDSLDAQVVVLFLSTKLNQDEQLLAVLNRLRVNDIIIFGVFDSIQSNWCESYLNFCDEYVSWPCPFAELRLRLGHLAQKQKGYELQHSSLNSSSLHEMIPNLVGNSTEFLKITVAMDKVARSDASILIKGDTGTGKEVIARSIHYSSERQDYPFIPVNCGALSDNVFDVELFGCEPTGAEGAHKSRVGLVAQSNGGTLFLDEVDTLSTKAQISLLRFLQDGNYRPIGSDQTKSTNVRIIAASKVDLVDLCVKGKFRQDLFFRLNILTINLPLLKERGDDIFLLSQHFLHLLSQRYNLGEKRLTQTTLDWMMEYDWPGNVRELQNILHHGYLMSEGSEIKIDNPELMDDNVSIGTTSTTTNNNKINLSERFSKAKANIISEFEKHYLTQMMCETNGNVSIAAKRAGKERRAFSRLLKKYGIQREQFIVSESTS